MEHGLLGGRAVELFAFLGIRGPMKSQDNAATKRIVYPMVCTGRKNVR